MALPESMRQIALRIAWKCYGLPYIWGGDDAVAGFDCSGFAIEVLQSVGVLPKGDWTAGGLWERFAPQRVDPPIPGCLVFWLQGAGPEIRHVEFCIGDGLSMGASGGGKKTTTIEEAIRRNAWIKVRPIEGRGNVAGFVDPFQALKLG